MNNNGTLVIRVITICLMISHFQTPPALCLGYTSLASKGEGFRQDPLAGYFGVANLTIFIKQR